jgi:hypothetical protein
MAASDAHPARCPLPEVIGYRARRSDSLLAGPSGRGGPLQFPSPPSGRSEPLTPGSSSRLQPRIFTASMAFTVRIAARLSLCDLTTRQASLHATDRPVAPPIGLLTLGFDAGRFPPTPPVCYRASWQLPGPDSHRQAMTSLRSKDQLQHQPHLRSTGRTPEELEAVVATCNADDAGLRH